MYRSPFLPVEASLWPLLTSLSVFSLVLNGVMCLSSREELSGLMVAGVLLALVALNWWRDLLIESVLGYHTHKLEFSLRVGFLLFILSEVFFFVSFFWAFFDASLAPSVEIGMVWPPKGIVALSPWGIPLLNTVVLLSSGVTATWAHHAILSNMAAPALSGLGVTVGLGFFFLYLQGVEYAEAQFTMADGVYGSTFFMSTGFHGVHVMIGSCFLLWVWGLLALGYLLADHHFSFEAAAWYWHFVDVVWLFLFISIYGWGTP